MELAQRYLDGASLVVNRDKLLQKIPKGGVTCEAGVASGDFSRKMLKTIRPSKHYMVDAWNYPGRYDEDVYQSVLDSFAGEIATGQVEVIRSEAYTGILSLPDKSIDFLYIDTSHSYKDTVMELDAAMAKITDDGIIAGHDYRVGRYVPEQRTFLDYGVIDAVNEFIVRNDFKLKYLSFESDQYYSFAIQRRGV
jgi:hypothetical protein